MKKEGTKAGEIEEKQAYSKKKFAVYLCTKKEGDGAGIIFHGLVLQQPIQT